MLAPLRSRSRDAEGRLSRLAAERAAVQRRLADPALYASSRAADVIGATMRLAEIDRAIAAAEADWLAAQEALAAAE